jgi:hypothetical protein
VAWRGWALDSLRDVLVAVDGRHVHAVDGAWIEALGDRSRVDVRVRQRGDDVAVLGSAEAHGVAYVLDVDWSALLLNDSGRHWCGAGSSLLLLLLLLRAQLWDAPVALVLDAQVVLVHFDAEKAGLSPVCSQ